MQDFVKESLAQSRNFCKVVEIEDGRTTFGVSYDHKVDVPFSIFRRGKPNGSPRKAR